MLNAIAEGPPDGWDHAEAWASRMRRWAQRCERLLVLSPDAVERVPGLLGVDADRVVWAPNGFEPDLFDRREIDRMALWRRWRAGFPASRSTRTGRRRSSRTARRDGSCRPTTRTLSSRPSRWS